MTPRKFRIHGTLGKLVANMKKGRESNKEITIFDSTGVAIEDIICAKFVYENAQEKRGTTAELFLMDVGR
jgi:alanine dehydrogenase